MIWIPKNVTYEEMIFSEYAARNGIDNTPPDEYKDNIAKTALVLQGIRNLFDRPIIISSGYRCKELNTAIGGSPRSDHMRGFAADFVVHSVGLREVASKIKQTMNFHQLIIEYDRWIHLSINPKMRNEAFEIK